MGVSCGTVAVHIFSLVKCLVTIIIVLLALRFIIIQAGGLHILFDYM